MKFTSFLVFICTVYAACATTCPKVLSPSNGRAIGHCENARVGDRCLFACHSGFEVVGQRSIMCMVTGDWNALPAACRDEAVVCPVLEPPAKGLTVGYCEGARIGDQCYFACQDGFVLEGSKVLFCTPEGLWDATPPTCREAAVDEICVSTKSEDGRTWAKYCSQIGLNRECRMGSDQRPGCVCKTGFKIDPNSTSDLHKCLAASCWDLMADDRTTFQGHCFEQNRICTESEDSGPECDACLDHFMEEEEMGTCVHIRNCNEIAPVSVVSWNLVCLNQNRDCVIARDGNPICESCRPGFHDVGGTCTALTCTDVTHPSGITWERFCTDRSRECSSREGSPNPECGSCRPGFARTDTEYCQALTCSDLENPATGQRWTDYCDALNKVCEMSERGPTCAECKPGFQLGQTHLDPCTANSCSDRIPDSFVTWEIQCWSRNRECLKTEGSDPKCGECLQGFKDVGGQCTGDK